MIDIKNKNKLDRYIIFSSKFQINLINKCKQLFYEGTFKTCPNSFYQNINIVGYLPDINGIIPILMYLLLLNQNIFMTKFLAILRIYY